jgi:hypothetical protein
MGQGAQACAAWGYIWGYLRRGHPSFQFRYGQLAAQCGSRRLHHFLSRRRAVARLLAARGTTAGQIRLRRSRARRPQDLNQGAVRRQYPGAWELQFYVLNRAASRFWPRCIGQGALDKSVISEVEEDDGSRIQYRFRTAAA